MLGGQAFINVPEHDAGDFLAKILADPEYPAAANFDIAAFHYHQPPEEASRWYGRFKSTLAEFGIDDRPIWITEAGQATPGPQANDHSDAAFEAQAAWLDRTLPTLVDLGASRLFWFQLDENPDAPSGFGLLGPDLRPRPAYAALQSLIAVSPSRA